jgi:uncharacterized protein YbcC (UPF0753/DUF2309 family)
MSHVIELETLDTDVITKAADHAARLIPPAWPLSSTVAVNPYLGQAEKSLADVGARFSRIGGGPVTMPRAWYQDQITSGEITDGDLTWALKKCPNGEKPANLDTLRAEIEKPSDAPSALKTVADLAADVSDVDWTGIIADRFGDWASGYFDNGQALWAAPRGKRAWSAWRIWATHDLSAEIHGLSGFAAFVADAPESPVEAMARAVCRLGLSTEALESYMHQLLFSTGGWAQYARYQLWRAELAEETDTTIIDLLAIRLIWEEALFNQYEAQVGKKWDEIAKAHAAEDAPSPNLIIDTILQDAKDHASQRELADVLSGAQESSSDERPALQAAFCIDVRSEVYRRALEALDPSIQTIGFAGFFGVFAKHRPFASDVEELRLPVLLNPTVSSTCGAHAGQTNASELAARYSARAKRAWGRFKLAAVSSFAFVEATGPVYIAKLVRDAFGIQFKEKENSPRPEFTSEFDLKSKIDGAEMILGAMSLTKGFARLVLLVGHGANVTNNPYASALHCGACGGYAGDVNARLLARLLNEKDVRAGLLERGIDIPADTMFLGAIHDTTTDAVTMYSEDVITSQHGADISKAKKWLDAAGVKTRGERAIRLPMASEEGDIAKRAIDWAEVRPEWALAGCKAFIAAPRSRSAGLKLDGRAFLHDYDWIQDSENGFGVLELIMTAPVVVASWISLQYYGSTVAPETLGSGNKLLHNVVGGVGVFEGNGGTLRAGLPWQSVHDGNDFAHEPVRLTVCIEAPIEAMTDVLKRHEGVRYLFDNHWLHLLAMDGEGKPAQRYAGNLKWEPAELSDAF